MKTEIDLICDKYLEGMDIINEQWRCKSALERCNLIDMYRDDLLYHTDNARNILHNQIKEYVKIHLDA